MAFQRHTESPRLRDVKLLDQKQIAKLAALSVTTVDDLLGLIQADAEAVGNFTEAHDLAQIQADAATFSSMTLESALDRSESLQREKGLVAEPPPQVAVEIVTSSSTFWDYANEPPPPPPPPPNSSSAEPDYPDLRPYCMPIRHQGSRGSFPWSRLRSV